MPAALIWLAVVGAAGVPASKSQPAATTAFVGLAGLGIEPTDAQPIERLLQRAVNDLAGASLVTPDRVTVVLGDLGVASLGECADTACLTMLGRKLRVGRLIYATLTQLGSHFVLVLKLVDASAGAETARVRQILSGNDNQLVDAVRTATVRLLQPEKFRGAVALDHLPSGARVHIDGVPTEASGDAIKVTVGRHALTVEADGWRTRSLWFEVAFDETARVDAHLERIGTEEQASEPATQPLTAVGELVQRRWPEATLAVGGLALATGGTFAILAWRKERAYSRAYENGGAAPSEYAEYRRDGERYARWTNITLGAGVTLAAAGGVGWWLRDRDPTGAALLPSWWGKAALASGGTLLATGGALAYMTHGQEADYKAAYRTNQADALASTAARGQRYALWTNVTLLAGTLLAGAGVADWLAGEAKP